MLPQDNVEWMDWQTNILNERNTVENVYRWACGQVFLYHLIRSLLMNNTRLIGWYGEWIVHATMSVNMTEYQQTKS